MEAIGYCCPICLPATETRLRRFHPDCFKPGRTVCVETDRRSWLDRLA